MYQRLSPKQSEEVVERMRLFLENQLSLFAAQSVKLVS